MVIGEYYVVQSMPKDGPVEEKRWSEGIVLDSRILGYGEMIRCIEQGPKENRFRLIKRTVTEEVLETYDSEEEKS